MNYKDMKTADYKFTDLCNEIDQWKSEATYWQKKYEDEIKKNNEFMNESMETAKKGVANALMFALHCSDDQDGNLVISKESRKVLAKQHS